MPDQRRIVLIIEGGVLQAAYADIPDVVITVVDRDNLLEQSTQTSVDRIEERETRGLNAINSFRNVEVDSMPAL